MQIIQVRIFFLTLTFILYYPHGIFAAGGGLGAQTRKRKKKLLFQVEQQAQDSTVWGSWKSSLIVGT